MKAGVPRAPAPVASKTLEIRSLAKNTRRDGADFLRVAAEIPVRTQVTVYPLREVNRALTDLKSDGVNGAPVLECAQ